MIPRGPFQPLPFCDSVKAGSETNLLPQCRMAWEDRAKKSVAHYVQPLCRHFLCPDCSDDVLSTMGCSILL